jgi:hypothetical protein
MQAREIELKAQIDALLKRAFGVPEPKAQDNFTDPDSRIMKTSTGFEQCFNAQTAVDASAQIIVAAELSNCAADSLRKFSDVVGFQRGQLLNLLLHGNIDTDTLLDLSALCSGELSASFKLMSG